MSQTSFQLVVSDLFSKFMRDFSLQCQWILIFKFCRLFKVIPYGDLVYKVIKYSSTPQLKAKKSERFSTDQINEHFRCLENFICEDPQLVLLVLILLYVFQYFLAMLSKTKSIFLCFNVLLLYRLILFNSICLSSMVPHPIQGF